MKRQASHSINNQRNKRARYMDNSRVSFSCLPIEVWMDHIIPLYPKDWLGVSKQWHDRVLPILFQDPRFKKDPMDFCLAMIQLGHISIKILLKYYRVDDSFFYTAIEHNQIEILKILIINESHHEVINEDTWYLPRLIDGIIKYGMVDILENIYSEFQFTSEAKKFIVINIIHPKFSGILKKIIQGLDFDMSWIKQVLSMASSLGVNTIMEWILSNSRIDLHDVHTPSLLNTVARRCNLDVLILLLKHSQTHFTDDDIISALESAAQIGNQENFMYLFTNYTFSASEIKGTISKACLSGNIDVVTILLNDPRVNLAEYNNRPIRNAANKGRTDIVRLLLEDARVDPRVHNDEILYDVIQCNHLQILQLLLQSTRIKYCSTIYYDLAKYACKLGQQEILGYLIHTVNVDPILNDNELLFIAIENNREHVVNLLLRDSRVDPSSNYNKAIEFAKKNNKNKMVNILGLKEHN